MDRLYWVDGENAPSVVELPNGDVWMAATDAPSGRIFRRHLGHVVEVLEGGRIRRVGAGLGTLAPWLRADGPLVMVIECALLDSHKFAPAEPAPAPAHVTVSTPVPAPAGQSAAVPSVPDAPGLLGRMAALLHRRDPASAWRDTMPHVG